MNGERQMLVRLCDFDTVESTARADDLLATFLTKLKKTQLKVDAAATKNQSERNLVSNSVRTLHQLQAKRHPLASSPTFTEAVSERVCACLDFDNVDSMFCVM